MKNSKSRLSKFEQSHNERIKKDQELASNTTAVVLAVIALMLWGAFFTVKFGKFEDVKKVDIKADSVRVYHDPGDDGVAVFSGGVNYKLGCGVYEDYATSEGIVDLIRRNKTISVWIDPKSAGSEIRSAGLSAGDLQIDPDLIGESRTTNKYVALVLAIVATLGFGLYIKVRNNSKKKALEQSPKK